MDETRYRKEAEFHDKAFAPADSRGASPFYAIMGGRRRVFMDFVRSCGGTRVLEYGCGPYTDSSALAENGASVVGIDISPVAISRYMALVRQKGMARISGCVMNAERLAFADRSFDLIVGRAILHHLDLSASLSELNRVLTPGGHAVFIEPLGHNPLINLYRELTPSARTPDEHPLEFRDFETARRFFRGLEIRYCDLTSLLAVPFRKLGCFPGLLGALERFDNFLFRRLPFLRRYAWTVLMLFSPPAQRPCEQQAQSAAAPAR